MIEDVLIKARHYWKIRNSDNVSELRTESHNALMDAMNNASVKYIDREDAAMTAKEMLAFFDLMFAMFVLYINSNK